jgi:protein polybromo-1
MTDWERTLKANKEAVTTPEPEKLPVNWLANGQGAHGSVTDALWALRNFMLKDALNLHRSTNR